MDDEPGSTDRYEYAPLRLSTDTDTGSAQARLTVAAEYGGWELATVHRYADGTRKVTLRRKATGTLVPGLSY